jgi:hypothetical protein
LARHLFSVKPSEFVSCGLRPAWLKQRGGDKQDTVQKNSGERKMHVSRLLFHTVPGKTGEVEQELKKLRAMVAAAGGSRARILHTHFASLGASGADLG